MDSILIIFRTSKRTRRNNHRQLRSQSRRYLGHGHINRQRQRMAQIHGRQSAHDGPILPSEVQHHVLSPVYESYFLRQEIEFNRRDCHTVVRLGLHEVLGPAVVHEQYE